MQYRNKPNPCFARNKGVGSTGRGSAVQREAIDMNLFSPCSVAGLALPKRTGMAPMTRRGALGIDENRGMVEQFHQCAFSAKSAGD